MKVEQILQCKPPTEEETCLISNTVSSIFFQSSNAVYVNFRPSSCRKRLESNNRWPIKRERRKKIAKRWGMMKNKKKGGKRKRYVQLWLLYKADTKFYQSLIIYYYQILCQRFFFFFNLFYQFKLKDHTVILPTLSMHFVWASRKARKVAHAQ